LVPSSVEQKQQNLDEKVVAWNEYNILLKVPRIASENRYLKHLKFQASNDQLLPSRLEQLKTIGVE
jgi:hypothetical protein